ncbi:MAG: VWA domain-containing protein [Phycisphaerae bacterium]
MSRCLILVVLMPLSLPGCRTGGARDSDPLAGPPPVLPDVTLAAFRGDEHAQGRDHSSPQAHEVVAGAVTMQAALSHALYSQSVPDHLILKVDLKAAAPQAKKRRPLNLALVFDRSGSMADEHKFMHALQAANLVFENLSQNDIVSLIAFNETAVVLSPAGRAVNKDFLRYRLGQFGPRGDTNLSAALLEAFAQIDSKRADGQLKQVIVLTDGMANRGVTDPEKLRNLVAAANARGIGVSTLGCGTEFSEEVLTGLAKAGGGRYTYVRSGELIPGAVAAELDGLLDVVAQNVKLEIRVAVGGAITRVYGRLIADRLPAYRVALGDLRDGDQTVLLVEIAPDTFKPDATVGVDVTLTLDNPATGSREQHRLRAEAAFSGDKKRIRGSADDSVLAYANVLDAMEKAEEAIQSLDTERFREARALFDRFYEKAHKHAIKARDQQLLNQTFLLKHFMAELAVAADSRLMHDHGEARRRIQKEVEYRRYLMEHHRGRQEPE